MGLITSAALAGCQHVSPVSAEIQAGLSSDVDGVFAAAPLPGEAPERRAHPLEAYSIWSAPLGEYPFERVEPATSEVAAVAAEPEPAAPAPAEAEPTAPPADTSKLVDVGIASTYGEGDGFQGRRTACGQLFDTHVVQVAHKSLPCGTTVRVEDTTTGKSVVARVTDRGPYVRGRVVDLSWAAFSQLHPTSPDLLSVRVYVVGSDA